MEEKKIQLGIQELENLKVAAVEEGELTSSLSRIKERVETEIQEKLDKPLVVQK